MFKHFTPQKIIASFRQVYYTFSQTSRLVWSANHKLFILSLAVNIVSGLLVFPTFYVEKILVDALIQNVGNPLWQEALRTLALIFLLRITIGIAQTLFARLSGYLQYRLARLFAFHTDYMISRKMSELDMQTIEDPDFKNHFNKVEREGRRTWQLAQILSQLPNNFFGLLSAFSIIFFFKPWVAAVLFLLAIPEFITDAKYTRLEYELESQMTLKYRLLGSMNYYLQNARNFLEVKIMGLSPYFLDKAQKLSYEVNFEGMKIKAKREKTAFLAYLPQNIFAFFFSVFIGFQTIIRAITVGSAQMYLRVIFSFQGSLTAITGSFLGLYENYLYVTDLVWYLDLKPTMPNGSVSFPKKIWQGVEFKEVWFRYKEDQPWILKGINLFIKADENLAIVGENGAGKTTFIKLLCRLYDPQKGEITIDGINLKDYKREELWRNFSVLFQNFETYPFSARESIGYGDVSRLNEIDEISQSAKSASIHNFISSLPLGYENPLATEFDKGIDPSMGQWQRIGLSRVLFRKAQMVVLDEPTSNVDPKSEEDIFQKISKFAQKKMLILISHRFSTVRRADIICVMDKGKIIESGSHKDLMKQQGIYANLFELQAKSYK
jgi:ABC-type multidrug transport system fused ATPase/permease subunit